MNTRKYIETLLILLSIMQSVNSENLKPNNNTEATEEDKNKKAGQDQDEQLDKAIESLVKKAATIEDKYLKDERYGFSYIILSGIEDDLNNYNIPFNISLKDLFLDPTNDMFESLMTELKDKIQSNLKEIAKEKARKKSFITRAKQAVIHVYNSLGATPSKEESLNHRLKTIESFESRRSKLTQDWDSLDKQFKETLQQINTNHLDLEVPNCSAYECLKDSKNDNYFKLLQIQSRICKNPKGKLKSMIDYLLRELDSIAHHRYNGITLHMSLEYAQELLKDPKTNLTMQFFNQDNGFETSIDKLNNNSDIRIETLKKSRKAINSDWSALRKYYDEVLFLLTNRIKSEITAPDFSYELFTDKKSKEYELLKQMRNLEIL